jgi:uncharacterized protein involved in outer membrane biogenesis
MIPRIIYLYGIITMKRVFLILISLIVLILGGGVVFAKYVLLKPEFLKTQLAEQSLALTGRKLEVNGDLSLSLFPFAIEAKDVTLANAKGFSPEHMASIGTLSLHVDVIPLLVSHKISVTAIELGNPEIYLTKPKKGAPNWEISTPKAAPEKTEEASEGGESLNISVSRLIVDDALLHYEDKAAGSVVEVSDFNAKGSLSNDTLPVRLSGTISKATPKPIEFTFESLIKLQGKAITLENTALTFNGSDIRTDKMLVDLGSNPPSITGDIASNLLDLNSLLGEEAAETKAETSSNEDHAWSREPIDFSGLKAINAQSTISIKRLKAKKWDISDLKTQLTLAKGKLENKLSIGEILDGKLNADSTVDGNNGAISAQYQLVDLTLDKMPDNEKLKGKLNYEGTLATRGRNQDQLMRSLSGNGKFSVVDGAIKGINILDMLRNVTGSFGAQKEAVTVFSTMDGTYTITDGVLVNDDLRMVQKKVDVTGEGIVDLGNQRIKYRITPNVAVKLEEATADKPEETGNLRIPVLVRGSLWNPTFAPDLKALVPDVRSTINDVLRDPQNAGNILENAVKQPSGDVGKNLEGLGRNLQEGILGGF